MEDLQEHHDEARALSACELDVANSTYKSAAYMCVCVYTHICAHVQAQDVTPPSPLEQSSISATAAVRKASTELHSDLRNLRALASHGPDSHLIYIDLSELCGKHWPLLEACKACRA